MLSGLAQYEKCCIVWRYYLSIYVVLGCVHVGMYHSIHGAQTRPHFIVHIRKPISDTWSISTSLGSLIFQMKKRLLSCLAMALNWYWCVDASKKRHTLTDPLCPPQFQQLCLLSVRFIKMLCYICCDYLDRFSEPHCQPVGQVYFGYTLWYWSERRISTDEP